eukprot:3387053-Rhodomonas_salina.4
MHFHSVAEGGDTLFVPLKEFYEMQDQVSKHGNKFQVSSAVCTAMLGFGWLICAGESGTRERGGIDYGWSRGSIPSIVLLRICYAVSGTEEGYAATRRGGYTHPLVGYAATHVLCGVRLRICYAMSGTDYAHTRRPFCTGWAMDDSNPGSSLCLCYAISGTDVAHRVLSDTAKRSIGEFLPAETIQLELGQKLDEAVAEIGIRMQWEAGDFAINDNLGNVHYATPGLLVLRWAYAGTRDTGRCEGGRVESTA